MAAGRNQTFCIFYSKWKLWLKWLWYSSSFIFKIKINYRKVGFCIVVLPQIQYKAERAYEADVQSHAGSAFSNAVLKTRSLVNKLRFYIVWKLSVWCIVIRYSANGYAHYQLPTLRGAKAVEKWYAFECPCPDRHRYQTRSLGFLRLMVAITAFDVSQQCDCGKLDQKGQKCRNQPHSRRAAHVRPLRNR